MNAETSNEAIEHFEKSDGVQPASAGNESKHAGTSSSINHALDRDRKEIRLLLLKAGSGLDSLDCELQQAFLTDDPKPEYETNGYC